MHLQTTKTMWTAALLALLLAGMAAPAVAQPVLSVGPVGAAAQPGASLAAAPSTAARTASRPAADVQPAAIKARSSKKGVVATRIGKKGGSTGKYLEAGAVTTDARGRVIVVGSDYNYLVVLRYSAQGKLDKKFGTQGVARVKLGKNGIAAADVVVDRKGRVVVTATSNAYSAKEQARVVRLTAKGRLDKKFASKGIYTKKNASASTLLVDAKNRVALVGRSLRPSGAWITRLTAKGKVDTRFGTKGSTWFSKYGDQENAFVGTGTAGALFDSQGRIVVHVSIYRGIAQPSEFGLARLRADGTLDESFYGGGWQTQTYSASDGTKLTVTAGGLAATRDGGFVTAGGADGRFALIRYGADGEPWGITDVNSLSKYLDERAVAIAADARGRVVSAGTATQQAGLTRHTSDYRLDRKFATKGAELRKVPGFRELRVADLVIDAKGRTVVLASGFPKNYAKTDAIVLLRYTAGGKPDKVWGK